MNFTVVRNAIGIRCFSFSHPLHARCAKRHSHCRYCAAEFTHTFADFNDPTLLLRQLPLKCTRRHESRYMEMAMRGGGRTRLSSKPDFRPARMQPPVIDCLNCRLFCGWKIECGWRRSTSFVIDVNCISVKRWFMPSVYQIPAS